MTVDIIVPTHRRADLLPEALASVQRQTYQDWICWIAEDGDTAETREAIAPFLADRRFAYLPGLHAGRPAIPRNRAIACGKGEFIAFLDDDDIWLPEKLAKQVDFLEAHPSHMLIGCDAIRWDGAYPPAQGPTYLPANVRWGDLSYWDLLQTNWIINSSAVARRSAVERVGPLDEHAALRGMEDYEYWLRLATTGPVAIERLSLLLYRDLPTESIRSGEEGIRCHYNRMADLYAVTLRWLLHRARFAPEESRHYHELCLKRLKFFVLGPERLEDWRFRYRWAKTLFQVYLADIFSSPKQSWQQPRPQMTPEP